MAAKRYYGPARPKGLPKGFDSWDEVELAQGLLKSEEHHPVWIPYTVNHKYQPDFVIQHSKGEVLVEFKGYFRDAMELAKYTWVRKALEPHQELVFIFDKVTKPIHFKPKRKGCGTKMTCEQWAIKNQFQYFNKDTFVEYYNNLKEN